MSENDESDKPQNDTFIGYRVVDMPHEIYTDEGEDDRELIYRWCAAFCLMLPFLPFWYMWLAGKWLVQRLRK